LVGVGNSEELRTALLTLTEKIRQWSSERVKKTDIALVGDAPIMKIRQYTPKIVESKIQKRKVLKAKLRKSKGKLISEIRLEQQVLDKFKHQSLEIKKVETKQSLNRFMNILDEQKKELNKLKTMQASRPARKVKGKRLAGNKQK